MDYSVYEGMTASEKQVADYLKELQLWWHYESPVFLKDEKRETESLDARLSYSKVGYVRGSLWFRKSPRTVSIQGEDLQEKQLQCYFSAPLQRKRKMEKFSIEADSPTREFKTLRSDENS
jgi:hypothetical protein